MKVAIYCRTSTTEQYPEKQLADCRAYCVEKGFTIVYEKLERLSGFKKNVKRPEYEFIKDVAAKGEIKGVVVWALDRWVRDRDTMLDDIIILKNYGCNLYSVKESYIQMINIEGSMGKTITEFLLGLAGSMAEMESQRKSDRTKMAFNNKKGRWGRKPLSDLKAEEIIRYFKEGKSIRWISQNLTYTDKNKNPKNISIGAVHKIIKNFKAKS